MLINFLIIFTIILIFFDLIKVNLSHAVEVGPCLLQFLEPCSETIKFYLFSSDKPEAEPIQLNEVEPKVPDWIDMKKSMKMIIHGYNGHVDYNATKAIRDAYLMQPFTNVIVVDWGKLVKLPCYPSAAFNTKQAGECTANFVLNLLEVERGFNLDRLHVIGFSLGAHVASFVSNALEKLIGKKLNRITGLDPALPFFSSGSLDWKLDKTDGNYIDVIHTNAGIYGKIEPSGHVDFYVNGGQFQPGCRKHRNKPLCSHLMAAAYFAESIITKNKFYGIFCQSYFLYMFGFCDDEIRSSVEDSRIAEMGEKSKASKEGIYFVSTYERPPYAMGMQRENSKLTKAPKFKLKFLRERKFFKFFKRN